MALISGGVWRRELGAAMTGSSRSPGVEGVLGMTVRASVETGARRPRKLGDSLG